MTWSEISYMSDCFCNIVLDDVTKEDRISTVVNCNATAETHNRKFGTATVAGQLDCPASIWNFFLLELPTKFHSSFFTPCFFLYSRPKYCAARQATGTTGHEAIWFLWRMNIWQVWFAEWVMLGGTKLNPLSGGRYSLRLCQPLWGLWHCLGRLWHSWNFWNCRWSLCSCFLSSF